MPAGTAQIPAIVLNHGDVARRPQSRHRGADRGARAGRARGDRCRRRPGQDRLSGLAGRRPGRSGTPAAAPRNPGRGATTSRSRGSNRRTRASRSRARAARSGWWRRSSTSTRVRSTSTTVRRFPWRAAVDVTFREPLGVVGLITPWNFPLNIASWKIGPALATGNTIVIKPAELTPLTTLRLGELALEAGIPEGVLNVVVGKGSVVGQRLVEHPDVAKIGFTGSTEVGRHVMQGAAATIKRVTLELGGKSANVVFADADLEKAAASAPYSVFDNAGQDCCARSRILVERIRLRPLRRAARRGDARRQGGRPDRRRDGDGAADLGRAPRDRRLVRGGRAALPRRRSRRGRASGSRARSSRRRTTTASRARRCSAPSPR